MSMPLKPPGMSVKMWCEINAELARREREEAKMIRSFLAKNHKLLQFF